MLKILKSLDSLKGKTALVRCGFDVDELPHWRVDRAIPFIEELNKKEIKTILLAHRGRPDGKVVSGLSLEPVFNYLKSYFGNKVGFKKGDAEILLLENLRFNSGERNNSPEFAKKLADLGDVYINNDFSTSHRKHASINEITKTLPSFAGPLIQEEIKELSFIKDLKGPELVLILGGAKPKTKLKIIDNFTSQNNQILLGGVLATTFLKKKGVEVGASVTGDTGDIREEVRQNENILLPSEIIVSESLEKAMNVKVKSPEEVTKKEAIVDLSDKALKLYIQKLMKAKFILWNGPLGLVEIDEFREGSRLLGRALESIDAKKIVGGGDIVQFLEEENLLKNINYVSTGGGAMLEFLAGEKLPGLEALGYYE